MERDNSHHLRPPDGFTEPSLGLPCELRLCPAYYTSHICHKVGEKDRVEGFSKRVDAELVEDVLTTGFFCGRTKIRTLKDDGLPRPTFHSECSWGDGLSGKRELPLHTRLSSDNKPTSYSRVSLSIPSVHVLKFAAERSVSEQ